MSLLSRAGVQYKTIILKKITKLPPFSEILPYDQLVPRAWFFLISVLLSKIYVSYYCIYRDSLCETSLHSRTLLCVSLAVCCQLKSVIGSSWLELYTSIPQYIGIPSL